MISSVSPFPNLLAPKVSTPVLGDAAAFGLVLAELGQPVVGRQPAAPTGKPVPSFVDIPAPMPGPTLLPVEETIPDAPPPMPIVPAAHPKPAASAAKPVTSHRSAKAEHGAHPFAVPQIAADDATDSDPAIPVFSEPVIERDAVVAIGPVLHIAQEDRTDAPAPEGTPDLAPSPTLVPTATAPVALPHAAALEQDEPPAPLVVDAKGPSVRPLPATAPIPMVTKRAAAIPVSIPVAPVSPMLGSEPLTIPVAPGARSTPGTASDTAPLNSTFDFTGPALRTPATAPTAQAGPVDPAASERDNGSVVAATLTIPTPLAAPIDRPAGTPVAAPAVAAPGRATSVTSAPSPTGMSIDGTSARPAVLKRVAVVSRASPPIEESTGAALPPLPAAPTRFAGSPLRPMPGVATPVASMVAPAVVSAPATAQATPVIAAPLPAAAVPIEQAASTAPSSEPRPDAAKPTAFDRLPAAPVPTAMAAPAPAIARSVVSGSARQVFAADLRRASRDPRAIAGETLAAPTGAAHVAAAAAPVSAPLDLRQDRWPSAMVERIERLRDAVDATDTRIRLVPDALGSIDVAVKRDGDTVHVHFTAEQAATRALIQDAAPRLAEAAEARGLKLGQTAVGGDGAQPNGRQPQPQQPSAPAPARPRSAAAASDEDAADTRIA